MDERYRTTSIPAAGAVVASATIASTTLSGVLKMHTSVQSHFVGDVAGWFTGEFDQPLPPGATTTVLENPPPSSGFDQLAISDDGGVIAYRTGIYKALGQQGISIWKRDTGITTVALSNLDLNHLEISGDGSTLLFDSLAAILPGDTNGVRDVYSYRISDGTVQRESLGVADTQLNTSSTLMAVSDAASLVAFTSTSAIVAGDLDNLDDLYVMSMPPADVAIQDRVLMPNPLVVIAPASHPLASRASVGLRELRDARFILREPGSGTRMATDAHFRAAGFSPNPRLELGSNEAIREAVAANLGVAVVSVHALQARMPARGVAVLRVRGFPIRSQWHVVHPKGKRLSPIAEVFREHLSAQAREWSGARA